MKSRKKLKGMTLVEIIIAMAVFAMLGVILLSIGKVIDSTTKASSRLNKKMTVQAPYAAAKNVGFGDIDGDGTKEYYYENNGNQYKLEAYDPSDPTKPTDVGEMNISVYFGSKTNPTKVKVQKYELDIDGNVKKDAEGNPIKDGEPVDEPAMIDMDANKYSTKKLVEDNSLIYNADAPNANLNFQFIDIPEPTTQPTT